MADIFILSHYLQKRNIRFQIDPANETTLCFKETLLLCLKDDLATEVDSVGNCCISVESIGPQKSEFLINIKFCMDINNHFGGSKIICSATDEFDCLEEKRTEYMYHGDNLDKKTLYIGIQNGDYYVEAAQIRSCDKCRKCKNLVYQHDVKLLSEGTNLLLMRYLAIINYSGELTYKNIIIDGDIATCYYKCIAAKDMELCGNQMKVYTIERVVENQNGKVESMKTYLTPQGKILEHYWMLTSYMLKNKSLGNIKPISETFKIAIQNDYWAEDMEIFSKFLDEKEHQLFEGSISSYCSTNSLCLDDVTYVRQDKTESNTTVLNLDMSMEYKTEKEDETDFNNVYNF
ncbi:hypothetical protein KPH14_006242 [Odynerus spinipes]|uniref:Ciliogenesis-associated TTC17-interacting protein N-terminal domain-containing protein n=1 Tax=Odynerus spinipes TaxID=1348599 RepID=A0AAD9RIQ9_9HYME|nr:hypothetical protein KPH14_006242 [Odynerus spinipes]